MKHDELIPTIDLAGLTSGDSPIVRRIAAEIGAAARGAGFFSVINHGIDATLLNRAFAMSRAFFALQLEEKSRVAVAASPVYRGYVRLGEERLDPTVAGDVKECFNAGPDLSSDHPDVLSRKPFHGPNQWPSIPGFREPVMALHSEALELVRRLHGAIALDLGLDAHYFVPALSDAIGVLRLLRYPPHPSSGDSTAIGAGEHTDYGNLTVLAQDDTGGLEVRMRDGTWTEVPPVQGSLVCNIGDCLMRWTNDVYVSNAHRVINRSGRERFSIAFFGDPNSDALVSVIPSCVPPDNVPKYSPITFADYLRSRYDATYDRDKIAAT